MATRLIIKRRPAADKGDRLLPALLLIVFILAPCVARALTVPEKLTYELSWTGIKAGTATQEIVQVGEELKIVSIARSAEWISVFYPIEDRIESTLSADSLPAVGAPLHYRMKIREGKHHRDKEISFDSKMRKAYYRDNLGGDKAVVVINDHTYDIYSSFYYIRFAPLEVGKSVFVTILDGKDITNLEVRVLKKEKIGTKYGTLTTFLLKPLVKKEGIFENKGDLLIWVTDDARRLPVKVQAKVVIGSITATLVDYR